ncbi:MAG: CARDB domain-containing protein, partial [Nitrospira sp.]
IWKENVYLSLDNTVTYDDILIGSFDNVAALDPGQSYTRTTPSVQVPIRFRGNVFLLVSTDHNSQVDEFPNDGNNVFAKPLFVEPYPLSDLYVGNVVAPDQVLPSTQIEVRYRVENRGSNTTDKTTWTDTLWLTVDKTRPYAGKGDILLGTFTHQGALPVGDFYEQVVTVTIPDASRLRTGINTYYITPWSDTYDVVLEDTLAVNKNPDDPNQIDNNNYKARPVIVIGNPPPVAAPLSDVTVTSVTPLTSAEAGKPFTVRWTVTNQGQGVVPGGWEDSLWLSSASTLNASGAIQWHLGNVLHAQGLAAGATATFEETFTLSPASTGAFVIVEAARNVSETSKSNNTAFAATSSVINQSDLRVSSVVVPVSADSGEKVHVQWTVENVGNAAVWSGTQYWTDHVYLSSEPAYSFRATKVGFLTHSNATTLAAGASYTAELDVTIPAGIEGPYFIHVIADANQEPFNVVDVRQETNPGSNPGALIHYRTSVYEAGNVANNFRSASLPVVYKEPDLVATTVTAPATASSGQPLTVSWTTTNQGTRATRQSSWTDRIYLSLDSSLDSTDRDLGFLNHTGILAQGASYTATTILDLPIGVAGTYFLLVFPDATRSSTGDLVPEFRGEGNNIKAQSITITLTTPPDLQVTQLTIPERVTTGQEFNVSYQVSNQGGQGTPASQSVWNDLVYLSRDTFFDAQADRYLGTIGHTGGLAVGQSYGITQSFKAPNDLSGSYYVLVITDPRNASGVSLVYEGNAEQNNDRASIQPLLIEQPPPADLEVQSITAGGTVKAGDPIHIEWTVKNNGPNVATGAWSDSVYLSTDDTWDINDRLLGQKSFSGPLTANQTYSLTLDSTVPPVAAGQYRIIVRTDIRNQVFEGVNEINNRRFSSDVVNVTVDSIQLGVPFNTTLSTGQDRLYKVTVLEGETLRVRVSTAANDAANEVYLRFNQAPTPFQFDAGPNTQLQPNTTAIIPATQPGEYYILIHGQSEPAPNTSVTLLADTLPFGITDVVKDQGGDSKYVTFTINGAKFSPNAIVKLVRPDIAEYVPVNINVVNSTKIIATFDFTDAPHGLYDVKVINPDGATAILPYRYLVERFIQPDVTIGIGGPRVIPVGEVGTFGISLQSLTNLDTPYVSFQFGVSEMGRNSAIYSFPFLQFANNLRGQPEGVREDVPWASLESDINAQGPLNNYNTSTGYTFDLVAGGFTGVTFN